MENEHTHVWGARVDGLAHCTVEGCTETDYDSRWGEGMFTDWPIGETKPYGA